MTENILKYLKIEKKPPTLDYLQALMIAYCKNVPWENVSKIVKKGISKNPDNCVRFPEEFWNSTLQHGTGGTCYESNWAFYWLLETLGFEGYLTINKIIDKSSVHSAIIIKMNGQKYIVDIGYPTYTPIHIIENTTAITNTTIISYRATAISSNEYIIENFPHPKPYLYHLTDIPVSAQEYLKIASDDYGEAGLFMNSIIIRKLVDNIPTRFDSEDIPYNIHLLQNGIKERSFIKNENLVKTLSTYFKLDEKFIIQAFDQLGKQIGYSTL